jgi:hypothetical protein
MLSWGVKHCLRLFPFACPGAVRLSGVAGPAAQRNHLFHSTRRPIVASSSAVRSTRAVLAASVLCALIPLSACGPSSGGTSAHAAGSGGSTAGGSAGGGPSYALTAPPVAGGYPQGQPPAAVAQLVDADIKKNAQRLGLSGSSVSATYDDRADGAWIFYSGVNGTGFDPAKLHDALEQIPASNGDGAGDRFTTDATDTDPGPHAGRAICDSILAQAGLLTTTATTCSWFTPTTAAGVTLVLKGDGTNTKLGFTAADVAPIMRAIRADVEQPRR